MDVKLPKGTNNNFRFHFNFWAGQDIQDHGTGWTKLVLGTGWIFFSRGDIDIFVFQFFVSYIVLD